MNRLPPLRLLTTFSEVARLGSMREAANRLNVSQPAVTQALRDLEDHIGVELLDRSKRPARLTEDGQQLAIATRDGLGQISAAIEVMRARGLSREKQVTVACTLGMATYWLMPRLPDFYARCSDITVNVQAPPSDLPALIPGIDIVLRYGNGSWDGTGSVTKLFEERVFPVGKPELVQRLLSKNETLETAPLINVASPENFHWAGWQKYLERRTIRRANTKGPTFNNYVQATQAALDGQGLMLGWRSITGKLVRDGSLMEWPHGELDLDTAYYVIESETRSAAAVVFTEWLCSLRN
ncbi:LysR family transcriptional regulator [Allorhizobium sp. BGMRC 0089]|uniref:LysR family transcriptional regulator n=1 Tax=Allorhizobium sonneratiae TaxID=2934936 RepID=UPI0020342EC0|nr:LysR family transcriptional regulator [Allorhizobium sonneratiae]MCM2292568.1 LysR family transcriptional regulator [Allorhizobium sonneratiae]